MSKRMKIFSMTGGRCFYCGCELDFNDFHLEHFSPKANGGKVANNLVPSCPDCNLQKSTLSVEEFRERIRHIATDTHHGRLMMKYYNFPDKPIVFFFEGVEDGIIQNRIDEFLDRQQGSR